MSTSVRTGERGGLWRSRWAAVGAACAVTFGGGGAFWAHAESGTPAPPTIEAFEDARSAALGADVAVPTKTAQPVGPEHFVAQSLGTDAEALTSGATFFPIAPYRSYDSRQDPDGLLTWGDGVFFDVITDVNSSPRIPASAVAVTFNLTITGTFGSYGFLTVYPAGAANPGSSSINWFAPGLDLANGGVVSLGNINGPGQVVVDAGNVPGTATDFIIDITGYYE